MRKKIKENDKYKKIINFLKKNKFVILLLIIITVLLTYCSLQCFPGSDDLPYSLFYRGSERVTNIKQIYYNQRSDYLTINGRFFVHCMVQFMLMFNRNLFSLINALCIVTTIIFMNKINDYYLEKNNLKPQLKNFPIYCLMIGLFLLIRDLKYMVYWQAGSINYLWVFTLIIIFIYYYLINGLNKKTLLNCLFILLISILHESSFCFILILIIFDFIKNIIEKKKLSTKKVLKYLIYCIISILAGMFIIKSPGNIQRMANEKVWYSKSILERFEISLPIISKKVFGILSFDNIVPTIFIICLILMLLRSKKKSDKISGIIILILSIISYFANNGWLYFILAITIFLAITIYNYQRNNNYMTVLWVAFYAVVYSMAITPLFAADRPNYYMYIFMITNIAIYINTFLNRKKILNILNIICILLFIFTGYSEYKIYSYIGNIKEERLSQIEKVKQENLDVLEIKKIAEKYNKFHPDANCPANKEYWTYNHFIYYYDLPEGIEVKLVD